MFSSVYSKIMRERERERNVQNSDANVLWNASLLLEFLLIEKSPFLTIFIWPFFEGLCLSLHNTQLTLHIKIMPTMSNMNGQNNLNDSLSLSFLLLLLVEA